MHPRIAIPPKQYEKKLMQRPSSVRQSCSNDWQLAFIRENIMPLGYVGWKGYLAHGRGLVTCKVAVMKSVSPNMGSDFMRDNTRYVPASDVVAYLQRHNLLADISACLMSKMQTYCPDREIIIFIEHKGEINISLLTNLAIVPPDCYRQVCNRWEEFYLEPRTME